MNTMSDTYHVITRERSDRGDPFKRLPRAYALAMTAYIAIPEGFLPSFINSSLRAHEVSVASHHVTITQVLTRINGLHNLYCNDETFNYGIVIT